MVAVSPSWPGHEGHTITVWDDHAQMAKVRSCKTCDVTERFTYEQLEREELERQHREHPGVRLSPLMEQIYQYGVQR